MIMNDPPHIMPMTRPAAALHPTPHPTQLTDWNMASLYGKLAIFIFAAWAGLDAGGVIAGLAVCGVVFASVSSASDLMQDFRTGWVGWGGLGWGGLA